MSWIAPVAWLGCGGGGSTDIVLPSLTVTTATTGVDIDTDGYDVSVDGSAAQPIGVNGAITLDRLGDGQHTVQLSGLASNCTAEGANPRSVTVQSGNTTTAAFAISCTAPVGVLVVTISTSGDGSDPDGFELLLDGVDRGPASSGAIVRLDELTPGPHSLGLTGLAANCQLSGDNPRSVVVAAGQVTEVPLAVTCTTPPPTTGTLEITTATGGSNLDPDGYSVAVDGAAGQPIGLNASLTVTNISSGQHTVELLGVATNCTVSGTNPRRASTPSGGTVPVPFAITCSTPPPGTGSAMISAATSGSSLDQDGYTVSLDGGNRQKLGINQTLTIGNLAPGSHSVALTGAADNCTVSGDNPRTVTISAGQTSAVQFVIACVTPPPTTGNLQVTAATSGDSLDPDGYTIQIDQHSPQALAIDGSKTIGDLAAGAHTVALGGLAANCTTAGANPRSVTVTAGQTVTVAFTVTCTVTQSSVNLHIEHAYLTQSTQTLAGEVRLVQGRRAYLRVFALADRSNSVKPSVRVRFFRSGSVIRTLTILAPSGSVTTDVREGSLNNSWNVVVDGSLIQPDVSMLVDVDPNNSVKETNENDNNFPSSGSGKALTVESVAPAQIRFVPIKQNGAAAGNVNNSNKDQLIETARRIYPLNEVQTDVRDAYSTSTVLQPDGTGWDQVLSDIEMLRVTDPDGANRTYYGVANLNYQFGIVGLGFVGLPSALGTDAPADVKRVAAHELGHTWNQLHTPCGNPPGTDPNYPYGNGIGVYGFDVTATSLKPPSTPDIMGYCFDPWISDYTYNRVMSYRQANPAGSRIVSATKQPALLVWGRIVNGQPVLEPVFQVVNRTVLPARAGAYSIQGVAGDGSTLFDVSFDAVAAADDPHGSRHFAFAVPLDPTKAAQLSDVRLRAPGGVVSAASMSVARLSQGAAAADSVVARRDVDGVALSWNPSAHPMVMVRDPDTGEVLSFARGGNVRVSTSKSALEVVESDGVHSRTRRIAVSR